MDQSLARIPIRATTEPVDSYGTKRGYQSWMQTIRRISMLPADELQRIYGEAIQDLSKYGSVTLRELVIVRAFQELVNNPNPSMLNLLMERDEGKVPQAVISATGNIGDWMEYARENNISIEDVMREANSIMDKYNEAPKVVEGEIVE